MVDLDHRRRRALYRASHRGTMEMDILLGRYAQARLPAMQETKLTQFEQFIALPDPDLHSWILSGEPDAADGFANLLAELRTFHGFQI